MSMGAHVKPNRVIITASLAVAAIALTGCGTTDAGSAAVVGDQRISERVLADSVAEVVTAQDKAPGTVDPALTTAVLNRLIQQSLVEQLSQEAGIDVTAGAVENQLQAYDQQVGGRGEVEAIFLESGVAPSQVDDAVRMNLQVQALGEALVPGGTPESQQAALVQVLAGLSEALDTRVSPRFGTWDAQGIGVGALPDDLSVPAA